MRAKLVLTTTIAILSVGCQGGIGDGSPRPRNGMSTPGNNGGTTGVTGNPASPCQSLAAGLNGPSPLQRLSRAEFTQSTNDLLNDKSSVGQGLPIDDDSGDLGSGARSLIVTSDWLNQAMQAAEDLAAAAVKSVTTLAPCPAGSADDACARSFITSFGKRTCARAKPGLVLICSPAGPGPAGDQLNGWTYRQIDRQLTRPGCIEAARRVASCHALSWSRGAGITRTLRSQGTHEVQHA